MKLTEAQVIKKETLNKVLAILEGMSTQFNKDYNNSASSKYSINYLEGKCDGLDLAISEIEILKQREIHKAGE